MLIKNFLKISLFTFLGILVIFGLSQVMERDLFFTEKVKADASDNVSGWAWSENIGWISFNCHNDYDGDGSLEGHCITDGFASNYGVDINETSGNFSGYAYSENVGYIMFNPPPNFGDATYPENPQYSAKIDFVTTKVSGWVRACSGTVNNDCNSATRTDGWDGWIKLRGITNEAVPQEYGVSLNPSTKEFEGWAYGNDVVGWLSFNHLNCDPNGDGFSDGIGDCPVAGAPISDYKVIITLSFNSAPYVQDLEYASDYCVTQGKGRISFEWTYKDDDGDNQSHYWLQVATDSGFGPEDIVVDFSDVPQVVSDGGKGTAKVDVVITPSDGDDINYNDTYYWQVKVKDGEKWSTNWEEGASFTTPFHAYPWPDFDWSPTSPAVDEVVQLCSTNAIPACNTAGSCATLGDCSVCYDAANNPVSCSGNTFLWTLPINAEFNGGSANSDENPEIKFTAPGSIVTLQISDGDGYSCNKGYDLEAKLPLPWWREIIPF